ncbi:hypothetical protein BKA61DRAFT_566460 [Leptodontidium sp. MPI-SDFR-AT-0119]|nr:hypothetical protein BKA61DRAFT_566460 [Leptodontidium sp. MPI-SDFR-AT-0119]
MVPSPTPGPGPGPGGAVPPDLPPPLLESHPPPQPIPPNEPVKAAKGFLIETEPKTTSISTSSTPISTFLSKVKKIKVVFTRKRKAKDTPGPAKRARIDLDLNTYHIYEEVGETAGEEEIQEEAEGEIEEEIEEEIQEDIEEEIQEENENEQVPATATTMEKPSKRRPGRPRTTTIQSTATSSDESTAARSRRSLSRSKSKSKSKSEKSSSPSNPTLLLTVHKEADAMRGYPTPSGDINNLPSFLLDNVNVEAPPGVVDPEEAAFFRNIIHQTFKPGSNLRVTGLLTSVEDADKNRQIALFLHQYLELDHVRVISVGCTDDIRTCQLWLLGRAGWYEIRPKLEYRKIFEDMMKAIGLKFVIDDWYYGLLSGTVRKLRDDEVREILLKCAAKVAGDGDNLAVWTARCKEYAPFLLSQMDDMDKEKGQSILKNSAMYKWLSDGAPALQSDDVLLRTSPEPDPPHPIDYSTSDSQESSRSRAKNKNPPYHGPYLSSKWPQGTKKGDGFVVLVAALICHMVEHRRWTDPEKLNVNKIHNAVYRDLSLQWMVTCKMLVTYYGEAIAALLPPKFHKYAFYKDLAKSSPGSALDRALVVYEKSKARTKKMVDGKKARKIIARDDTDNEGDGDNVDREDDEGLVARDDTENEGDGDDVDREDGEEIIALDDTENEGGSDTVIREKEENILALFDTVRLKPEEVRRRKCTDVSSRKGDPSKKASRGRSTPPDPEPKPKPAQLHDRSGHIHPDTLAIIQPTMGQQLVSAMTADEFSKHIRARVKVIGKSYSSEDEGTSTTDGEVGETVNRSEVQTSARGKSATRGKGSSGRGRGRRGRGRGESA